MMFSFQNWSFMKAAVVGCVHSGHMVLKYIQILCYFLMSILDKKVAASDHYTIIPLLLLQLVLILNTINLIIHTINLIIYTIDLIIHTIDLLIHTMT